MSVGPNTLTTVYCNDEDIAIQAMGDYNQLVPQWSKLAYGVDGIISGGDLWTLTSASNDFEAVGILPPDPSNPGVGNIFRLSTPQSVFKGAGELFGVAAASGNSVTLRRIGMQPDIGFPPSPAGGLTGITFVCMTFTPQIEMASYNINQIFGVTQIFNELNGTTDATPMHKPSQMYLLRDLNSLTVLYVLKECYEVANRAANGEFSVKLKQVISDYEAMKSRTLIRWGSDGQGEFPSSMFGARVGR